MKLYVRRFPEERRINLVENKRPDALKSKPGSRLIFSLLRQGGIRIEGCDQDTKARSGQRIVKNIDPDRMRIPVGIEEMAGLTGGQMVFVITGEEDVRILPAPDACQRCSCITSAGVDREGRLSCICDKIKVLNDTE